MATTTSQNPLAILSAVYKHYLATTPQRTKLIDAFLAFLVVTGVLQFLYCVLAGNYVFSPPPAGHGFAIRMERLIEDRMAAVQCLSGGVFGNSWAIRFDRYLPTRFSLLLLEGRARAD